MKNQIELNNQPAEYNIRVCEVFQDGLPIAPGSFVTVCAWCVPHSVKVQLKSRYKLSDGLCESCAAKVMPWQPTEKQCSIADHYEDLAKEQKMNEEEL